MTNTAFVHKWSERFRKCACSCCNSDDDVFRASEFVLREITLGLTPERLDELDAVLETGKVL